MRATPSIILRNGSRERTEMACMLESDATSPSSRHCVMRNLTRNTGWNLAGAVIPIVVAFISIPILVSELGAQRFGLLTIIWAIIGYFNLFELGLGRALTYTVAAAPPSALSSGYIVETVWTTLLLILALGAASGLVVWRLDNWLVTDLLSVDRTLVAESAKSIATVAISLPLVTTSAGLRGVLEGLQRFDLVNLVRIPSGAAMFLVPAMLATDADSLVPIAQALVSIRTLTFIAFLALTIRTLPSLQAIPRFDLRRLQSMLTFGGWITVSNIIGPMMTYLDRFLVGSLIGIGAVTYYVTPYEVVARGLVAPAALVAVLFPTFASFGPGRASTRLLGTGMRYVVLGAFPVAMAGVLFAREALSRWIGADIAMHSARVMQILSAGALCNAAAQVPFAYIQGVGRVRATALIHIIELPVYALLLVVLTTRLGIVGTAIAWAARSGVDLLLMSGLGLSFAEDRRSEIIRMVKSTVIPIAALTALIVLDHLFDASIEQRSGVLVIGLIVTLLSLTREDWARLGVGMRAALTTRNRV
jgi:O-antigen/teichoic acid export membrane protein